MRLISLELSNDTNFWFLGEKLQLTPKEPKSKVFDLDALSDGEIKAIDQSVKSLKLRAYDSNNLRLKDIFGVNFINGDFSVSIEDIEEEDKINIKTVTVSLDEEEEPEEQVEVTSKDRTEAKQILSKNGNTAKKYIANLDKTNENVGFLTACLDYELSNNKRNGIIELLNSKLEVFNE